MILRGSENGMKGRMGWVVRIYRTGWESYGVEDVHVVNLDIANPLKLWAVGWTDGGGD